MKIIKKKQFFLKNKIIYV